VKIVVEPQDFAAYKNEFTNLEHIVLPANNMGITYARNFITND
jgi:hypothetical protein